MRNKGTGEQIQALPQKDTSEDALTAWNRPSFFYLPTG
jgi:hypothetical protein